MATITVIGVVFVDVKGFPFEKYQNKGRNLGQIVFFHGGVCRNVAENIAGTGHQVNFVSLVDNSAIGDDVIKRLKKANINTDYILNIENGLGMWLAVMDETGDIKAEISKMPDTAPLEKMIDEKGDEIFAASDSVVVEYDLGESLSEKAIALAEKHDVRLYTVVGNMSVIAKRPDLIRHLACFICNETEMGKICGKDLTGLSPEEMLHFIQEYVHKEHFPPMIVTMGEKGSVYYNPKTNEKGICPSIASNVIDTTGAGDAFLSGAVVGLEKGLSMAEAAMIGTKMAHFIIETDESSSYNMNIVL